MTVTVEPQQPTARIPPAPELYDALQHATTIFERHGIDSLSPFILRPDKEFLFGGDGVFAYRSVGRTMIASGDPVAPDAAVSDLVRGLLERARGRGERLVIYGASERYLDAYRSLGLHILCTGEEAIVEPSRFTLEGRAVRKLRQSVHRVDRRGWRIRVVRGRDLDHDLVRELKDLDAAWRTLHGHCRGFAMATGEPGHLARPSDVFALAFSPCGHLSAAMRFLAHRDRLSLDTMQRAAESTNGLNEALICRLLEYARAEDIAEVSLNYAGLAHLVRQGPQGGLVKRSLTRLALGVLRSRFQMDRLVTFNEKFHPQWRQRYLVYGSRLSLPAAIFRVLQAEGYLPEPDETGEQARTAPWAVPAARAAAGHPLSA